MYYNDERLVIRPMKPGDIPCLLGNFKEQGWSKPEMILRMYLDLQANDKAFVFLAEYGGETAGYTVLHTVAKYGPFAGKIPEISDFVVFIKYQRNGIGTKILDTAEAAAAHFSDTVSLGVGLHSGYGAAQRLYAKRGYVPDGSGVWFNNVPLEPYADCTNNDELVLYLSKML